MKDKYYSGHVDFEDIEKMTKEEKMILAKTLSEGNKKLERLLLNCWKHKINTFACCKGHDKYNMAYLGFVIDENSFDYTNQLLNNLEPTDYSFISISSANNDVFDNPKDNRFAIDIQIDYRYSNHLFDTLNSYLSIRTEERINELLKHGILLNQIFLQSEISTCIMKNNKEEMLIDITKAKEHRPPKLDGDLEKNIQSIKQSDTILCNRYNCTNDSLKRLIRCFYKNYNPDKIKRKS
ncbi:MAG: hypothetical protein IJ193_01985 [Bacilli bacterium]|nr:hypothetical protein [Bacilli bacterium]